MLLKSTVPLTAPDSSLADDKSLAGRFSSVALKCAYLVLPEFCVVLF